MWTSDVDQTGSWAPQACTLRTREQPLRAAEFDEFFTHAVRSVDRAAPTRLVMDLEPTAEVASQAGGLAARENGCCAFFTFILTASGGALGLQVSVPSGYVDVLDALAHRAVMLAGALR